MTRLSPSGPWSHKLVRMLVRALFWFLGLFVRQRAAAGHQLPWQADFIVRCANLAVPRNRLRARKLRRLYRFQAVPWNLNGPTMAEVLEQDLGESLFVRIYRPAGTDDGVPALLFFHGGGFVIGDFETHDVVCRYIADRLQMVVVAVKYRLAPEHNYPAQINDADRAYLWLTANADRLGIASDRVAIGGDSAGGTLALSVALASSRRGDIKVPALLWMIYPWLELHGDYPSYEECGEDLLLAKPLTDFFRKQYLSANEDTKDPALSPGLAVDLSELPPTFLLTAGIDPLRDEGFAFAKRLADTGVPIIHHHRANLVHDFLMMGGIVPEAREAIDDAVDALGRGMM
jgi:acetyl esterase